MDSYEEYLENKQIRYSTGRKELLFGLLILICAIALVNFTLFGGLNLGYSIVQSLCIVVTAVYLLVSGCKLSIYSGALLTLSLIITAGFARSDDGFVKFIMLCFLFVAVNLGLGLQAGKNRRNPDGIASLLDAPSVFFMLGIGKLSEAFRGLREAMRNGGKISKNTGAVLVGVLLAIPLLVIVVLLLISADAAFAGLVRTLPSVNISEVIITVVFGTCTACVLYTRGIALQHSKATEKTTIPRSRIHPLTVNTILTMVCIVYLVYLFSQLAYFAGGFSGILPNGYTMAQYARRGFFEMAWLCAINLGLIALTVGLVRKTNKTPLSTRILCLFIGIVTLFFVITASAKMAMYISSYGLTRLRVLTEVIMVFLGIATVLVCFWLFVPKMPYMKALLLVALVMGAVVLWVDVDTLVAHYNIHAYQSGRLEAVDVEYLSTLSAGAIPYIAELAQDGNQAAQAFMEESCSVYYWDESSHDLRSWNWADWLAGQQWKQ